MQARRCRWETHHWGYPVDPGSQLGVGLWHAEPIWRVGTQMGRCPVSWGATASTEPWPAGSLCRVR